MFIYTSVTSGHVCVCVYVCTYEYVYVFVWMYVYLCDLWTCVCASVYPSLGQVRVCGNMCLCDVRLLRV